MEYWESNSSFTLFKKNDIKEACRFLDKRKDLFFRHWNRDNFKKGVVKPVLMHWHKLGYINLTMFQKGAHVIIVKPQLKPLVTLLCSKNQMTDVMNMVPNQVYGGYIMPDCTELYSQKIKYGICRPLIYKNLGKKRE